jgi:hypothetical protein
MLITLKDLVPVTLTRKRGEEAYNALQRYLGHHSIDIDLDGSPMLSSSFLDEFIVLAESNRLRQVAFVTRQATILRKLGIIAHERDLTLYSKASDSDVRLKSVPRLARTVAQFRA